MILYDECSRTDLIDMIYDLEYENEELRDKINSLEQQLKAILKLKECD